MKARPSIFKTFNDPVYGFITVGDELIFSLIEHPYFQRLRRISQLGLTNLVYSGANHNRFQHALGAMHLMSSAIAVLRSKGVEISQAEEQGAKIAILLHDIGHGPFSHALEHTIVRGISHEQISRLVMQKLNQEFNNGLSVAIQIYDGTYPVQFLHQLVSSQLDMDRLDYLNRDSFFTGVSEGVIGVERIVNMLCVHNDMLAVEAKAVASLERFLMARRHMYWQVYLHKTVLSAEFLLMNALLRARELSSRGMRLQAPGILSSFLESEGALSEENTEEWLPGFMALDDHDVIAALKHWRHADDAVLRTLCTRILDRQLLKTESIAHPLSDKDLLTLQEKHAKKLGWTVEEASYLVFQKRISTRSYVQGEAGIRLIRKDQHVEDLGDAATLFRFATLNDEEARWFLYHPEAL